MGTTQRTKSNGFLALPAAQKSASSTGGGPSGEFGARNSPRAGPNHPRGVRTEYNRRLARRRPPGGAARPTRVRGSGAGLGVQERVQNPTGGAIPRVHGVFGHRAGERSLEHPPSGGCKPSRKASSSLFKIVASFSHICWLLHILHLLFGRWALLCDGLGYSVAVSSAT